MDCTRPTVIDCQQQHDRALLAEFEGHLRVGRLGAVSAFACAADGLSARGEPARSALSGATGGARATALGTTTLPMVGTEKLMAGESGVTTTTRGAISLLVLVLRLHLFCFRRGGGVGGSGWMMIGTGCSIGGGTVRNRQPGARAGHADDQEKEADGIDPGQPPIGVALRRGQTNPGQVRTLIDRRQRP